MTPVVRAIFEPTLECLPNTHRPGVSVFADSRVGAKIYMIFLAEHKPYAPAASWQKILAVEQLIAAGHNFANPSEPNHTAPLWQLQSILQLCGNVPLSGH